MTFGGAARRLGRTLGKRLEAELRAPPARVRQGILRRLNPPTPPSSHKATQEDRDWKDLDPSRLPPLSRKVTFRRANHLAVFSMRSGRGASFTCDLFGIRTYLAQEYEALAPSSPFSSPRPARPSPRRLEGTNVPALVENSMTVKQPIRFCINTSRAAVSKSAVERNHTRNRFKAAVDLVVNRTSSRSLLSPDIVYLATLNQALHDVPLSDLCTSVEKALKKLASTVNLPKNGSQGLQREKSQRQNQHRNTRKSSFGLR